MSGIVGYVKATGEYINKVINYIKSHLARGALERMFFTQLLLLRRKTQIWSDWFNSAPNIFMVKIIRCCSSLPGENFSQLRRLGMITILLSLIGALMGLHCGLTSVNNQVLCSCSFISCWWFGGENQKSKNEKALKLR